MASLKDMRVRIASTKATQKITKAMQMVAASKLRRAQTAAEAARPYAEQDGRGDLQYRVAAAGSPGAPALLAGTGKDQVHLLLVCTGERGLSGAFNSSIVRLARERALFAAQPGQGGQDSSASAARATSSSAALFDKQIVEHRRPALRFASSASSMPRTSPRRFWRASMPANSTSARCSIRASNR